MKKNEKSNYLPTPASCPDTPGARIKDITAKRQSKQNKVYTCEEKKVGFHTTFARSFLRFVHQLFASAMM